MRRAWTVVVAAVLALSACGGDDGPDEDARVPAAEWAATVCGEVQGATTGLAEALSVIDELPTEIQGDAPLGEHAEAVREAFQALPEYVERYRTVVEDTAAPDIADGAAFRDEVLADLESAEATFDEAADAAEAIDEETTVADFFGGAQAFAAFPQALAASDLDFGDDVPPDVAEAMLADRTCIDAQNELLTLIGGAAGP